jgi:putative lipoprotein
MRSGVSRRSLLALAVLVIAGQGRGEAQQGKTAMDAAARLTGGTWLAEDIRGGGVIDNARSTIAIAPDGAVTGSGGCNRLMGLAKVEAGALTVGPLATTRMACVPALMDQERKFLAALEATRSYRFEGAVLRFYDAAGTELIRFTQTS